MKFDWDSSKYNLLEEITCPPLISCTLALYHVISMRTYGSFIKKLHFK